MRAAIVLLLAGCSASYEPDQDAGTDAAAGETIAPEQLLVSCDGRSWGFTARLASGRVETVCMSHGEIAVAEYDLGRGAYVCEVNGSRFTLEQTGQDSTWIVTIWTGAESTRCWGR